MLMMLPLLLCIFVLEVISSPTAAASPGGAMESFGLVGSWSTNCALSTVTDTLRANYEVPLFGSPKIKIVQSRPRNGDPNGIRSNDLVITDEFEIEQADRIADDKIQIMYSPVRRVIELDGKVTSDNTDRGQPIEVVIQKQDSKIRVISRISKDGKSVVSARDGFEYQPTFTGAKITSWTNTNKQTPVLDKCLQ
jgi:hypothetical protein